jgi:hypothetical protein
MALNIPEELKYNINYILYSETQLVSYQDNCTVSSSGFRIYGCIICV